MLDPAVRSDTALLWFDPDGAAVSNPKVAADSVPGTRANLSIEIYNLNEARLRDARLELSTKVNELVEEANLYWAKVEVGERTADQAFERTIERLCKLVSASGEFSAAAHSALMRLRGNSVVPDLVLNAL